MRRALTTLLLALSAAYFAVGAHAQQQTPSFGGVSTRAMLDATNPQYAGGMKCDATTDDTAALQAAINAADAGHTDRTVALPGGKCNISGVTIHAPVSIQGAGRQATILNLVSGSTKAAISVQITATDWPNAAPFAYVTISDLQITSPSRLDAPGIGVAHGIAVLSSSTPTPSAVIVELWRDLITLVPGDCVNYTKGSGTFGGNVKAYGTECAYPGRHGVLCNSGTDWQWNTGPIYGAVNNNVQLSGCVNFRFQGVNMFVAGGNDVNLFNSDFMCESCFVDQTGTDGVFIANAGGQQVDFIGTRFRWPGQAADHTYSNIHFAGTNTGSVYCSSCRFDDPAVASPAPNNKTALNNLAFVAGNTGNFYASGTTRFDAGDQLSVAVTGSPQNIFNAAGSTQIPGKVVITSAKQFDGFIVNNGTNAVAKLMGSTATNDAGAMQLLNANAVTNSLVGNGVGYVSPGLSMGGTALVQGVGTLGLDKGAVGVAPGAAGAKLTLVCGTTAGTAKLIAQAGTSATAVTIIDNIGAGVTGC
jgi:hypothetical protein